MEKIKVGLLRIIIFIGLAMLIATTLVLTYLHIIYLPRTFYLYREIIIIFCALALLILSYVQRFKVCSKIALIVLIMGIFNVVGFNFIAKMM